MTNKRTNATKRSGKAGPGDSMGRMIQLSPREILLCLRERGLVAAALAVVVCSLLGWWSLSQPKVYQASSRLLLERSERVVDMAKVVDQDIGGGRYDAMFATLLEQIVSPAMTTRVLNSLSGEERVKVWRPYSRTGGTVPAKLDDIVKNIIGRSIRADRQSNTFFIRISAKHRDPEAAALLATRYAHEFILYQLDRNTSVNNSAISFLRKQTNELRNKAEESEKALQEYREQTKMVSLDESRNIVVDRMKTLSSTVTQARVTRLAIEARLRQAEAIMDGSGDPLELATTAEFSSLANVQSQIDDLRTQRAIMAERYGVRHPQMIDNNRSTEALIKLREDLVTIAMANLRNQQEKARSEESHLQEELNEAQAESLRLDAMAIKFNALRREAETNRLTYSQLLNRLSETTITAQLEGSNVRLSDEATVPGYWIEPDTKKITMMLVVLGVGIFLCYPIGLELIFNRVRGWADVESYLGLPLLGEVPSFKKIMAADRPHLISRSSDEEAREIVRSFYSQYKLGSRIDEPKTILVTSTLPSEGKSFIASNMAEAFAAHGAKTLIIDTDLRRPVQHRSYGVDNERGLLHWLEQKQDVPEDPSVDPDLGIHQCADNLYLLRTGGSTRRSTEVLQGKKVAALLSALSKQYDVLIIDTPPAGVFPDAFVMAEEADELIYVVRHNHVARPAVRRILQRFVDTEIEQSGIILNMMPSGRGTAAHYSGYGHYGSKYYTEYQQKSS